MTVTHWMTEQSIKSNVWLENSYIMPKPSTILCYMPSTILVQVSVRGQKPQWRLCNISWIIHPVIQMLRLFISIVIWSSRAIPILLFWLHQRHGAVPPDITSLDQRITPNSMDQPMSLHISLKTWWNPLWRPKLLWFTWIPNSLLNVDKHLLKWVTPNNKSDPYG